VLTNGTLRDAVETRPPRDFASINTFFPCSASLFSNVIVFKVIPVSVTPSSNRRKIAPPNPLTKSLRIALQVVNDDPLEFPISIFPPAFTVTCTAPPFPAELSHDVKLMLFRNSVSLSLIVASITAPFSVSLTILENEIFVENVIFSENDPNREIDERRMNEKATFDKITVPDPGSEKMGTVKGNV